SGSPGSSQQGAATTCTQQEGRPYRRLRILSRPPSDHAGGATHTSLRQQRRRLQSGLRLFPARRRSQATPAAPPSKRPGRWESRGPPAPPATPTDVAIEPGPEPRQRRRAATATIATEKTLDLRPELSAWISRAGVELCVWAHGLLALLTHSSSV